MYCGYTPLAVNIGTASISPSPLITLKEGDAIHLQCSVDIAPHPLPANTSTPELEWFFGQTFNGHLNANTTSNGSNYTSTYSIATVRESDEGTYTCRLRGNQRTAVSTFIHVGGEP